MDQKLKLQALRGGRPFCCEETTERRSQPKGWIAVKDALASKWSWRRFRLAECVACLCTVEAMLVNSVDCEVFTMNILSQSQPLTQSETGTLYFCSCPVHSTRVPPLSHYKKSDKTTGTPDMQNKVCSSVRPRLACLRGLELAPWPSTGVLGGPGRSLLLVASCY